MRNAYMWSSLVGLRVMFGVWLDVIFDLIADHLLTQKPVLSGYDDCD